MYVREGMRSYWFAIGTRTAVSIETSKLLETHELFQNYPNPFNMKTTILYRIRESSQVQLAIFDASGREVAVLEKGKREPGEYRILWDGRDARGNPLPSGIYICRLLIGRAAGTEVHSRKVIVLK